MEPKTTRIVVLILKIIASVILAKTFYFKFVGTEDSVKLFTAIVGAQNEAYMRIGTGVMELIAIILLFVKRTSHLGALLGLGLMGGAVLTHLTIIGVGEQIADEDGGLFYSAIVAGFSFLLICIFELDRFKHEYCRLKGNKNCDCDV
ncbi:MAG: DoxX family protein [Alphaproteobacteria bacterium]|nr:DoxX family protein [Alphaproteobacteria bacterium]